jgi:hypothetical protein
MKKYLPRVFKFYQPKATGGGFLIFEWTLLIICFKIKNLPTLHSTSKIQPTTSPTFVFSVFESVRKTWGYEIKLLTAVLVVVHRVF